MAVNPETKLDDLRAKLQARDKEVGKLVKAKESLRTEVAALEKVVREINQFSNSYSQALQGYEKSIEDMENYSQTHGPEIEAAVGDKKEAVNTKIEEVDSRVKKMKKEQQTLEEKVEKYKSDYEAAKQDYLSKQKEFNSLKTLRKTIEDKLNDMKTLRASIERGEREGEETDTAHMYFLTAELDQLLAAVKAEIRPAEEYKALLIKTWQEVDSAETAVKKREEQMREAEEKYEMKKRELELVLQDRRKTILTELANI
jgi:chromosome segregation ATPase